MRINILVAGLMIGCLGVAGCDKKEDPKPTTTAATATMAPTAKAADSAVMPAAKHAKHTAAVLVKPVPADWVTMRDEKRGFEFKVPHGSKDVQETKGGFTIYAAEAPKPNDVNVMVVAYKDAKKTKDDLFGDVDKVLVAMGSKDVKLGTKKEIDESTSVAEITFLDDDGKTKNKGKVLVVTDVTDNYLMIVGGAEANFKAEEPTIDEIIGSLSMDSAN